MNTKILEYAKKTFLALNNPYDSVKVVYPNIINYVETETNDTTYYLGVKDSVDIPKSFVDILKQYNVFQHTIDTASINGRAIDINLKNPYTGNPMTGSSSGTAINVFLGINDLGLGTDGGGSVLAPAAALNLFSFISPLLGEKYTDMTVTKQSTDGILFSPSLGFMSKQFCILQKIVTSILNVDCYYQEDSINIKIEQLNNHLIEKNIFQDIYEFEGKYSEDRKNLMVFINEMLQCCDVIISKEGPVDFYGLGDSVLGHFDKNTKESQAKARKGFLRIANMIGVTAMTVPTKEFATSYVLICYSKKEKIVKLFEVAKRLACSADVLSGKYFSNADVYFANGVFPKK